MLADSTRSSMQPSPYADQPQYGAPLPFKGEVPTELPQLHLQPHRPAFTILPAGANAFNLRALAQSTRYLVAQSKAQDIDSTVGGHVRQVKDIHVAPARDGVESRNTTEEENLDDVAAGILVKVAKGQHAIFAAADSGTSSVNTSTALDTNGTMNQDGQAFRDLLSMKSTAQDPQKCPIITCEYHQKGFSLKVEREKHTITHFEGDIECGSEHCCYSSQWPHLIEDPKKYFDNVEQLKSHVGIHHDLDLFELGGFKCFICCRILNRSGYFEHLNDCIVHTVELKASAFKASSFMW